MILTVVLIKFNVKIDFITPVKINLRSNISEPREERNVMSDGYRNIGFLSINNKGRNDLGRDHVKGMKNESKKLVTYYAGGNWLLTVEER